MFNKMMGIPVLPALLVTSGIIMLYLVIGGAHADILTDGVQGALMLLLAIFVGYMFFSGFGIEGGYTAMVNRLVNLDPDLVKNLHPTHPVLNSWWDVFAIFVAHLPLGLLPHIGNKLWALKGNQAQNRVHFLRVYVWHDHALSCARWHCGSGGAWRFPDRRWGWCELRDPSTIHCHPARVARRLDRGRVC